MERNGDGDLELMKLQAKEMSRVMQEVSDLEFAYLLQLEEALRISAMLSGTGPLMLAAGEDAMQLTLLSEDRQIVLLEQTREVETLNQELDDSSFAAQEQARFLEIDEIVEHDAEFARRLASVPQQEWAREGEEVSEPYVGDGDMGSLTERLQRRFAEHVQDVGEDCGRSKRRRRGKEFFVARSVWEPMVLSKVFFVTAEDHRYVGGPSFWPAERKLKGKLEELAPPAAEVPSPSCLIEEMERCSICLEFKVVSPDTFFKLHKCGHEFCTDCLHQYAEAQAKSGVVTITCPQPKCPEALTSYECNRLLDADSFQVFCLRQVEAAIPEDERSYCPFQDCSALCLKPVFDSSTMSSTSSHPHSTSIGAVECFTCHRLFCVECKVPWHADLTCQEFQDVASGETAMEDMRLNILAKQRKWQRCYKCQHMVEHVAGCFHMSCRCGAHFCYLCGKEWVNSSHTCVNYLTGST